MMCLYKKDLLSNVIEIHDTKDNTMVKYTYDAWENHTVIDYTEFGLGNINPTAPPVRISVASNRPLSLMTMGLLFV